MKKQQLFKIVRTSKTLLGLQFHMPVEQSMAKLEIHNC